MQIPELIVATKAHQIFLIQQDESRPKVTRKKRFNTQLLIIYFI